MSSIQEVTSYLEGIAPPSLQESYDNSGLIVGDPSAEVKGVILCLDSIEAVLDEAIEKGCNLVIAHHPIVFRGLKSLTGRNYVERTVIKAIKNDIAIYACHTNLDNVAAGVNAKICRQIGLKDYRILAPKEVLSGMQVTIPIAKEAELKAILNDSRELMTRPVQTQLVLETGKKGSTGMLRFDLVIPSYGISGLSARVSSQIPEAGLRHSVQKDLHLEVGSGMIGRLPKPQQELDFLKMLKKKMKAGGIRYTKLLEKPVQTVAVCGGAGGFLLSAAIRQKADVFVTSDYKYHEFFDADSRIIIADIGHYESEQYTIELFEELITQKFSNFAVHLTSIYTNPVNYL